MIRECNVYNIHFLLRNYLFMKNKVVPFSIFVMFRKIKTLRNKLIIIGSLPPYVGRKKFQMVFAR